MMWITLQGMGFQEYLIDLLKKLYRDQEATVQTEFGETENFKIKKACSRDAHSHRTSLMYTQRESYDKSWYGRSRGRNKNRWSENK